MNTSSARRGFLRGLASLPLIGGGVALIGEPVGAAVPVDDSLLNTYSQWLYYERRLLSEERYPGRGREQNAFVPANTGAQGFHFPLWTQDWRDLPSPSTRAAVVLSSVGCPSRFGE